MASYAMINAPTLTEAQRTTLCTVIVEAKDRVSWCHTCFNIAEGEIKHILVALGAYFRRRANGQRAALPGQVHGDGRDPG